MNPFNFLFYLLLFVGFVLPTNSSMYIPLPGILLKVNELAFLFLPFINQFCTSRYKRFKIDKKFSKPIALYLIIVLITEFVFKPIVFDQSLGESFKSFRIGLPLYSSLLILYVGIKSNIKIVWKVLLAAIGISVVLSILSIFVNLPIYYNMGDEDVLAMFNGRISNSNSAFGIIGLYLLFADKNKWYNQGKLVRFVSILSVLALVISFNRTYLTLLVFEFLYLSYKTFSGKTFFKVLIYPVLAFLLVTYAYNNFKTVHRQIDKRILSIINHETTIAESTINNNRDQIYDGIQNRVSEGYWAIGMPYDIPIFNKSVPSRGNYKVMGLNATDTSLVNILLTYGIFPLILFLLIYRRLYKTKKFKSYRILLLLYLLASLNIDSLMRHNSIFFLIMLFLIVNLQIDEKNSLYSKSRLKY